MRAARQSFGPPIGCARLIPPGCRLPRARRDVTNDKSLRRVQELDILLLDNFVGAE